MYGLGHDLGGAGRACRGGAGAAHGMRIAVLGVGLIGGSIGLAARRHVEDAEVVGYGRSAERLDRARELGAIDSVAPTLEEALDGAEPCFACAPVGALPDQVRAALAAAPVRLRGHRRGLHQGARWWASIDDQRFVGGHPIAGAETSGVEHARADLFQDAVWYLTPARELLRPALRAPPPLREGDRGPAGGARPRNPRPSAWPCSATCRTCWPTCW